MIRYREPALGILLALAACSSTEALRDQQTGALLDLRQQAMELLRELPDVDARSRSSAAPSSTSFSSELFKEARGFAKRASTREKQISELSSGELRAATTESRIDLLAARALQDDAERVAWYESAQGSAHAAQAGFLRAKNLELELEDKLRKAIRENRSLRARKYRAALTKARNAARLYKEGMSLSAGVEKVVPVDLLQADAALEGAEGETAKAKATANIIRSPWFQVHAGVTTASPYVIDESKTPVELQKAKDDAQFYIETYFKHRTAWLSPKERVPSPGILPEDYEIRVGFVGSSSKPKASALAGSADWYTEVSLGWPLYESENSKCDVEYQKYRPKYTVNFEVNGGFATNRDALWVHGFAQAGVGSVWSIPLKMQGKDRNAELFGGLYLGYHEFPNRLNDQGLQLQTRLGNRAFWSRYATFGAKVDLQIPLTQATDIVLGGRLATPLGRQRQPDDWAIRLGLSVDVGRLVSGLSSD